jgi:hypothetical protein
VEYTNSSGLTQILVNIECALHVQLPGLHHFQENEIFEHPTIRHFVWFGQKAKGT